MEAYETNCLDHYSLSKYAQLPCAFLKDRFYDCTAILQHEWNSNLKFLRFNYADISTVGKSYALLKWHPSDTQCLGLQITEGRFLTLGSPPKAP